MHVFNKFLISQTFYIKPVLIDKKIVIEFTWWNERKERIIYGTDDKIVDPVYVVVQAE